MPENAGPDFSTLSSHFEDWLTAAGQDPALLDEPDGGGQRLRITRLGWHRARATGRGTEGLRVQADYLCTLSGGPEAEMDAALGALYAAAAPYFDDCAPLPPEADLWRSLNRAPEPALRLSLTVQVRPDPAPAPPARTRIVTTTAMAPIGGRVVHGRHAVEGALIRTATDPRGVTSDETGRFRLPDWRGDPLIVRKGSTEIEIRPGPDRSDILIDLKAEN